MHCIGCLLHWKLMVPIIKKILLLPPFKKSRNTLPQSTVVGCSGVSCGWRRDVQRRAYAESALPGSMGGRSWAMAELTRRALHWYGTSRRHLQETDEPIQAFVLLWNGVSYKKSTPRSFERQLLHSWAKCIVLHTCLCFKKVNIWL